ncbi:MAG: aldehyde dehydrogenase family protein [Pseudomonadota bacterium]
MTHLTEFYIDGGWISSNSPRRHDVINPATEERAGTITLGSADDVDIAIAAARRAFTTYSQTTRDERLELLAAITAVYKNRIDEVANAICTEMGAPLAALARTRQAGALLGHLKVMRAILKDYPFFEDNQQTRIQREPIGVCGMITPWNWPIHQIGCKVVPALAAGCTMVLKPSEFAPLSAHVFADILHEASVPAGVFNLVNGDGPTVGAALAAHPDVDFVSFTGSTRAGVEVSRAAAPSVKKVALELGGKSANILLTDADFNAAVTDGVKAMFLNTGQSCNAPSRMLVPREHLAAVESLALATAQACVVGDPLDDSTTMGPLANKAQFERVQTLIQTGVDDGAKLVCGGLGKPDATRPGFFVKPTVFSDVTNGMTIAQEEIFGPVLCILPYDSEEQAVEMANDTPYGLSGYVSGKDPQRVRAVASRLRTGNVHINNATADLSASFGGYKTSGLGREWGRYGLEEYFEIKSVFGFHG